CRSWCWPSCPRRPSSRRSRCPERDCAIFPTPIDRIGLDPRREAVMTTQDAADDVSRWFDTIKTDLLAQNPFREPEYFKRFAAGALSTPQVWGHISNQYLLVSWFPRIFSGIHARCDELEVRKDCARHLLVEDLGFFRGEVGGTPDHVELFRRIGDDLGYGREVYDAIVPTPGMA